MSDELKKILDKTNKTFVKIQNGTVRFKSEIINHDKNHWSVIHYTEEFIDGQWIRINEK